jgi:chromosomal replication initiator protein
MVRRALCKIIKVALTKELGKNAKLLYKIKMENTYGNKQPFTEQFAKCKSQPMKSQNIDAPYKNLDPELRNFCNSWYQNLKLNHN